MPWFRWFKRRAEQEARETSAPQPEPVVVDPPALAGEESAKPKRRRGTRGGRGRARKPAEPKEAAKAAEPKDAARPKAVAKAREPKQGAKPEQPASQPERRQRRSPTRRTPIKRPPLPPAKRELLVSVDVGERRVAVLEDNEVAEVYLERPERRSIAGNVYKGVVDNVLPGMEAAFVDIGLEKNGFLYVDEIVTSELEGTRHGRRIQDLLSRGQEVLVQAVKDPMKSKGARLTTEISLPGRFVVYVPRGEGLGVSRRLDDDERARLREILKNIAPSTGGVIVRTAAEGASAEDVERDLDFLQRLWKAIEAHAKKAKAPALVYQEAELPLRVVRDLFTGDFDRALVDHDRTLKRIVGYLKKTSPHMVERVSRYREKQPLFEAFGVDAAIRSTLSPRVDLPSGGYLIFDYAEAFTVIDVNTGRFVGSRGRSSGGSLEDTLTQNNLEAVKEVVRQLRLRDIGGIIVIDFIDMANPKNRAAVEEALKRELERDRTKTYVVEISPLGLVEMTRQNVTEGPREILTTRCPTCAGEGFVISQASAAVEAERRLRALAARSRSQAFRVELNAHVASLLIGPGAERLAEIEAQAKRRFLVEPREDVPSDHFVVLAQGALTELAPQAPVEEGAEIELKLVELGLHDPDAGIGKLDGYAVAVGDAAKLVGKKVKARVVRALDGSAYATLAVDKAKEDAPVTAEREAEKPTRKPRARTSEAEIEVDAVAPEASEPEAEPEPEEQEAAAESVAEEATRKRRTRRGSRGGRGRRRKTEAAELPVETDGGQPADAAADAEPAEPRPEEEARAPRIHVPAPELGRDGAEEPAVPENGENAVAVDDGGEPEAPRRRTRRGSRGGRNRRKKAVAASEPAGETQPAGE